MREETDTTRQAARHQHSSVAPPATSHRPRTPVTAEQRRTLRFAWMLLCIAFLTFCTLLASATYAARNYRVAAMDTHEVLLIARAPLEWLTWQRESRSVAERAQDQQLFTEGERLMIASSAGYGQAATVRLFDNSTLDMWAGADLTFRKLRTSRWNNQQQLVVLEQNSGYIRYDLRGTQFYEQVDYIVYVGDARIVLEPGGSYSINLIHPDGQVILISDTNNEPVIIDVAARSGSAQVQSRGRTEYIEAGERVEIDPAGIPSEPVPAYWQLVEDGNFSQYTVEEYNNTTISEQPTLPRSDTWRVFSGSEPSDVEANGFFHVSEGCPPPYTANTCEPEDRTDIAWFRRDGRQDQGFVTGVRQTLGPDNMGIDISEYRSLVFSIWVRVLHQSVELAGEEGSECPVMVRFWTKETHPTDAEQQRVICFYASDDPQAEPVQNPAITYYRVERFQWYLLTVDLREEEWLPQTHYIRWIDIYANGHDYDSRVTGVSLIGSQYPPGTSRQSCAMPLANGCEPHLQGEHVPQ